VSEDLFKSALVLVEDLVCKLELFLKNMVIKKTRVLTSSSGVLALFLVAFTESLFLKRASSLSARVGRSERLAYLTEAALTSASKNCL
jgi:hypothetical protein